MKIVIDISEHIYKQIMADSEVYILDNEVDRILIENAIYNGTPLPKNHGRLIDADELKTSFPTCDNSVDIKIASVRATINHAPTIIEESDSE